MICVGITRKDQTMHMHDDINAVFCQLKDALDIHGLILVKLYQEHSKAINRTRWFCVLRKENKKYKSNGDITASAAVYQAMLKYREKALNGVL